MRFLVCFFNLITLSATAQGVLLQTAPAHHLPEVIDGNSSSFWADGKFHLFHSSGEPTLSIGTDQFHLYETVPVEFDSPHRPVWFEAAWRDEDGTIFLWYHHEPPQRCGSGNLTAPAIGAAYSVDNGRTVHDMGLILTSAHAPDCNARNGFFSTGHGDMSVVLDKNKEYFYFFFTSYGGPVSEQGICLARMPFDARHAPVDQVQKLRFGQYDSPGIGGTTSPIFPTMKAWQNSDTDSYWGPAAHYNTFLEGYVVFLNRACCRPNWPQEGVYVAFSGDLSNPDSWSSPQKLLHGPSIPFRPGYYPQILGLGEEETDARAGEHARLYVKGGSVWELIFYKSLPPPPTDDLPVDDSLILPPLL